VCVCVCVCVCVIEGGDDGEETVPLTSQLSDNMSLAVKVCFTLQYLFHNISDLLTSWSQCSTAVLTLL